MIGHAYESFGMKSMWVTIAIRVPETRDTCRGLLDESNDESDV